MVIQLSDKTFEDLLTMIPESKMKKWVQSSSFTTLDNSTRKEFNLYFQTHNPQIAKIISEDSDPVKGLSKKQWPIDKALDWVLTFLEANVFLNREQESRLKAFVKNYFGKLDANQRKLFVSKIGVTSAMEILMEYGTPTAEEYQEIRERVPWRPRTSCLYAYMQKDLNFPDEFKNRVWFYLVSELWGLLIQTWGHTTPEQINNMKKLEAAQSYIKNSVVLMKIQKMLKICGSKDEEYDPYIELWVLNDADYSVCSVQDRKEYLDLLKQSKICNYDQCVSASDELMFISN